MKKTLFLFLINIGIAASAQQTDNPFLESEQASKVEVPEDASILDSGGGNPAFPAPIDDYIPLLILISLSIISYITYKKKSIN